MLPNPVGFSDRLPQFLSRDQDQKPLPANMKCTMYGAAFLAFACIPTRLAGMMLSAAYPSTIYSPHQVAHGPAVSVSPPRHPQHHALRFPLRPSTACG